MEPASVHYAHVQLSESSKLAHVVQMANMDLMQRMASSYFFLFNCPWLPERMLQKSDFKFLNEMFSSGPSRLRHRCAAL